MSFACVLEESSCEGWLVMCVCLMVTLVPDLLLQVNIFAYVTANT